LNRKMLLELALMLTMASTLVILPARAWSGPPYTGPGDHPFPTEDTTYSEFGPRVEYLLIKFYGSDVAEWEALRAGQVDITDWSLTRTYRNDFSAGDDPGVAVADAGGELGMFVLDVSNNPWMNDGANPDIIGDNPEHIGQAGYPDLTDSRNPLGDDHIIAIPAGHPYLAQNTLVTRGSQARLAIAHLLDRDAIILATGSVHNPMYTHQAECDIFRLGGWINDGAQRYPYSIATANLILDLAGYVDTDGDGIRNHDSNNDGIIDNTDANFHVEFYTRLDLWRSTIGDWIQAGLVAVGIDVTRKPGTGGYAWQNVMLDKIGHMYTAGWILSREPTTIWGLYNSINYWHPGDPPDYMRVMDAQLDTDSNALAYAVDIASAKAAALAAQQDMVAPDKVLDIPVGNSRMMKGYWKYYAGTEYWKGVINAPAYGVNTGASSIDSTLNMRRSRAELEPYPVGGTLEYGWKYLDMPTSLNPFQYSWYWDAEVIFRTYNVLLAVNPYNPFGGGPGLAPAGDLPWIASSWTQDVLGGDGPGGAGSIFTFTLRNDVYFHDGTLMTAKDIYYTVQFGHWQAIDHADYGWTGLPPWFWSNIYDITPEFDADGVVTDVMGVGVDMVDGPEGFTIRFNYNVESIWAFWWAGAGIPVVPKRYWWDRFVPNPTGSDGFAPDPQMVGTGPYMVYPGIVNPPDGVHYDPSLGFIRLDVFPRFFNLLPPVPPNPMLDFVYVDVTGAQSADIYILGDSQPAGTVTPVTAYVYALGSRSATGALRITGIKVPGGAGNFGVTSINLPAGWYGVVVTVVAPWGNDFDWQRVNHNPGAGIGGDLSGAATTKWNRLPANGIVDFRDLTWFLRFNGQTAAPA